MERLDSASEEFLEHLLAKRYSEARDLVLNVSRWSGSERLAGRRAGCMGLISALTQKRQADLDMSDGKMARLGQILLRLRSSLGCDEFDRGYIDVWLRFIGTVSGEADKRVKQDPCEEK